MVTDEMMEDPAQPYIIKEVDVAIKEMAPIKAPGPDGMPPLCFQTYWTDVSMYVTQAILSSLNLVSLLKSINQSFITLIPKVHNLERASEFRPIKGCLDWVETKLYNLVSITHNPKNVGPTKKVCLGKFFSVVSITQNSKN